MSARDKPVVQRSKHNAVLYCSYRKTTEYNGSNIGMIKKLHTVK